MLYGKTLVAWVPSYLLTGASGPAQRLGELPAALRDHTTAVGDALSVFHERLLGAQGIDRSITSTSVGPKVWQSVNVLDLKDPERLSHGIATRVNSADFREVYGRRPAFLDAASGKVQVAFVYAAFELDRLPHRGVPSDLDRLFVGYPSAPLVGKDGDAKYDPLERQWFLEGRKLHRLRDEAEDSEQIATWLRGQPDPVGRRVDTCAAPITNRFGEFVGVVAVDLFATTIEEMTGEGLPLIANLGLLLAMTALVWRMLAASWAWAYFDWVLRALALVCGFYAAKVLFWRFPARSEFWDSAELQVTSGLSLVSSVGLLVAALLSFNRLAFMELVGFRPLFGSFEDFMDSHKNLSPILLGFATTFAVTIALRGAVLALSADEVVPDASTLTWSEFVDAMVAIVALSVFGLRLAAWLKRHHRPGRGITVATLFLLYAGLQLPDTVIGRGQGYWWIVFALKAVSFGIVLVSIHQWIAGREWQRGLARRVERSLVSEGLDLAAVPVAVVHEHAVLFCNHAYLRYRGLEDWPVVPEAQGRERRLLHLGRALAFRAPERDESDESRQRVLSSALISNTESVDAKRRWRTTDEFQVWQWGQPSQPRTKRLPPSALSDGPRACWEI